MLQDRLYGPGPLPCLTLVLYRRHAAASGGGSQVDRWEPESTGMRPSAAHTGNMRCRVPQEGTSAARCYMPNSYYKHPHLAHVRPVVRALRDLITLPCILLLISYIVLSHSFTVQGGTLVLHPSPHLRPPQCGYSMSLSCWPPWPPARTPAR